MMSMSRDSAEDRDGAEMMSIDPKPSNVSMTSVTKLNVNTAPEVAESRDDSGGGIPDRESTGQTDERQGTAPAPPTVAVAATTATSAPSSAKKKGPPKKRNAKKSTQARTQGNHQKQRGAVPYHTQVMSNNSGAPAPYGGPPPSYAYGGPSGPSSHDLYGHPQYQMSAMQGYGAPGAPYGHPGFGTGPYSHPPPHMYPYQGVPMHQQRYPFSAFMSSSEDTASLGSSKSKSSKSGKSSSSRKKKRTIDGVDQTMNANPHPGNLSSAFAMRRVHSNASTSSTITTGHNTSTDTPNLTDSPQKQRNQLPPLSSRPDYNGPASMHEDYHKQGYHRRDFSGASTTSSLSVGGLSLSSYETRGMYSMVLQQMNLILSHLIYLTLWICVHRKQRRRPYG